MKMKISTAELTKALYRVQGIADKKSTMPVLAHVLLDATVDSGLTLSATDLDVGLVGTYDAEVLQPGSVAVHARQFYEIIKSLPAGVIELEVKENHWVEVHAGNGRFRLVGMAADEFPALPSLNQVSLFKLPAEKLVKMIDRTLFCVSSDDNRHNLSGIYCEAVNQKTLRFVSTDGHRLALSEQFFDDDIAIEKGLIVPRKGFQELKRVLGDSSENIDTVEMGFSGNSGVIRAGSVTLTTRLIEGQFPDYNQVIPKADANKLVLSKSRFSEALRRVSLLSQGRAYGVRLSVQPGKLELVAEDPEFGEANECLELDYQGEPLTIGFNARYIMDVLSLISEDFIEFSLIDDLSPGVIVPKDDPSFLAVVMPIRI
jgi:DNA polymerase-3 subunit beta